MNMFGYHTSGTTHVLVDQKPCCMTIVEWDVCRMSISYLHVPLSGNKCVSPLACEDLSISSRPTGSPLRSLSPTFFLSTIATRNDRRHACYSYDDKQCNRTA